MGFWQYRTIQNGLKLANMDTLSNDKKREYYRSIELFEEIFKKQGVYFALAFLYDSQYCKADVKKMMDLIHPSK